MSVAHAEVVVGDHGGKTKGAGRRKKNDVDLKGIAPLTYSLRRNHDYYCATDPATAEAGEGPNQIGHPPG